MKSIYAIAVVPQALVSKRTRPREGTTEFLRDLKQPSITRPQFCPANRRGRQQVNIDESDTFAIQLMPLDVTERLIRLGNRRIRKLLEQFQINARSAKLPQATHPRRTDA